MRSADEMGVEIWALPDEMLPDNKDPGFITARIKWQDEFSRGMFSLLSEAIHPTQEDGVRARRYGWCPACGGTPSTTTG